MTAASTPLHAFVAFLRIPQFESRSAAEQAALKEKLETRTKAAIAAVPAAERLVLDAEDGLAIVLFGNASRALDVTQAIHRHDSASALQVGLNYGPLALTSRGSDSRVFGDGLSAASAAARFASPEKLLVTANFAKALQAASPGRAVELANAGEFTDTRVRMHAFFTPDAHRHVMRQRRFALSTVGGIVVILLLGVLGRDIYQPLFQSRPAFVKLDVKPRGQVIVDGLIRGRVPPLTEVEVAPGKHRVQIRNPGSPTLDVTLDLKPGQHMTLTHTFVRTPEAPKPKTDLWRDLKKRFGN
ncbi:MAG: hypothetical protein ACXWAC_01350 [Usitatibacter sp.]